MKLILGDNQFFGINHHDLQKGSSAKEKFGSYEAILSFIQDSMKMGMDGFLINSNELGYEIVKKYELVGNEEIHYSVPYPHKYATMVNEEGMLSMLKYFLSNTSMLKIISASPKLLFTKDIKYLIPIIMSLEIPRALPKGSIVFMQNIVTDLLLGLKRYDILEYFAKELRKKGYKPGFITLNPVKLDKLIVASNNLNREDVTVCFNINNIGFNVFPKLTSVEDYIKADHNYKLMGMSIFASGGANIPAAIEYIKGLKLDYLIFGSSKLENIKSNMTSLKAG